MTTIHITMGSFTFIDSQRRRHEPRYQTLERIITQYHDLVEKVEWFKEAEKIARAERNNAENELFILRNKK